MGQWIRDVWKGIELDEFCRLGKFGSLGIKIMLESLNFLSIERSIVLFVSLRKFILEYKVKGT